MARSKSGETAAPFRVLIVDNYAVEREGLSEIMFKAGALEVCGLASDPAEALRQFRELAPDLVIVDLHGGQEAQLSLIRQILGINSSARILVMGREEESEGAARWRQQGATAYVNKYKPVVEIIKAVRVILGQTKLRGLPLELLTPRELEVFELLGSGATTSEAARYLHVSAKTIESHRESIKEKLRLANYNQFMHHAVQWFLFNGQPGPEEPAAE